MTIEELTSDMEAALARLKIAFDHAEAARTAFEREQLAEIKAFNDRMVAHGVPQFVREAARRKLASGVQNLTW